MNNRSKSKQNLNSSYFDRTSPLSNLQKAKQRNQLKNSIHNSVMDKIQMYTQPQTKKPNDLMSRSYTSFTSLKASTILYKLPQFTAPEVNYEISQAIKQKANQIKEEMVNNLPNLLNSSSSLPSLVPKSSNYNTKKVQNLFGHRSSILELQSWLRNSLSKSPPTTPQQLVEYKQMIMGVGMKELIRLINSRCLQEGKLVEQVWQLTWGICKEIIMHMALRARKCEQILAQQIKDFNIMSKRNFQEKEKQLIQLREKVKEYEEKIKDMSQQIEDLTLSNQKLTIQNSKSSLENNYVNEEFLNVLEENLAMYLHLGDTKKKDWIRKMYKKVGNAKSSIKDSLKKKVNKTVQKRMIEENIYQDEMNEINQLKVDQNGNFIVSADKKNVDEKQNANEGQQMDSQKINEAQDCHEDQICLNLKDELIKQFQTKQAESQTQVIQMCENEVQSETKTYQDKQIGQDQSVSYLQVGVNTEQDQRKDNEKNQNLKASKLKNQKKNLVKGSRKPKFSKRASQISQLDENKKDFTIPSAGDLYGNKSIMTEQEENTANVEEQKKYKIQIIDYVCKQCFLKKSKDEAEGQIKVQQYIQKLKQEISRLMNNKNQQNKNSSGIFNNKSEFIQKKNTGKFSDKKSPNDRSQRASSKNLQNEKSPVLKKGNQANNNRSVKIQNLKNELNKSLKDLNKQEGDKSSQRSLEKHSRSKGKNQLKSIEESRHMQDGENGEEEISTKRRFRNNFEIKVGNYQIQMIGENNSGYFENEGELSGQNSPKQRMKNLSVNSGTSAQQMIRRKQKKTSSIIHDIGMKKQIELTSQFREAVYNMLNQEEEETQNRQVVATLPINQKQPYFRFFTEQITQANQSFINQIAIQQSNHQLILNNYFSIVQEVNSIPESKIQISQKQMLAIIEKNLMPIILELLNTVKKSVFKKTTDNIIRTFHSLPFILMNKFSTKYGVKILAIKNMKLLLSSLRKIELITDRYKSLRLMLFTDCRAIYSQDLFVYLLVVALIAPHLDVQRSITFEQVTQIRQICQKYLTTQPKVYQQFESMTKEALSPNNTQQKMSTLKLAPLLRSIITNYRMAKINRIQQIGFVFLMLKKDTYLEYFTFSFFLSCFKIETDRKVKIVKTFLANCDLKNKNKRVAMSESGFSRFLIRCAEFNFEFLNSVILKQASQLNRCALSSTPIKQIQANKRMSEQLNNFNSIDFLKSIDPYKNASNLSGFRPNDSQKRLQTQKQILSQSKKKLQGKRQESALSECSDKSQKMDLQQIKEKREVSMSKKQKRHLSLTYAQPIKPFISEKVRNYSYFTYEINRFLQNEQETKYMTDSQRQFISNYLLVHVMACEVQQMVGLIDYFSNDMLEIVCCNSDDLKIQDD